VLLDVVLTVPENSVVGTIVGTVTGTDPDAGDSLTYSITGGNTSGLFAINAVTGKITVANSSQLDFETHPTWPLTVQVTDSHSTTGSGTVTINLTNVNEAPHVNAATFTIAENSAVNTAIGTVQGSDPDAGDPLTYSITGGNSLGAFAINSQTGAISVANVASLDFETHPTWPLTVQVTDSHGLTNTATVTINLTNVNEPPQLNNSQFSVVEAAPNSTVVGTVQGTDPDSGDSLTYSITAGNSLAAFAINSQTGAITVANSNLLVLATHPTWPLTIKVTDNHGANSSATVTVNLTSGNKSPVLNNSNFTIAEHSANNFIVGSVQGTDADAGDTLTYSIAGGNSLGAFAISAQTGAITVANSSLLDFTQHPTWSLTVQVQDNHGASGSGVVTINLAKANQAPLLGNFQFTTPENTANNTVVGTVQGSDPDLGDTLTYSITSGNSLGGFAINSQTGVISVADSTKLDFESHSIFSLTVQVADNHGATGTGIVTINLSDVNGIPKLTLNGNAVTFSAKAAKTTGPVHVLPSVTVSDPDISDTYKIGGGTLTVSIDVAAKVSKKGNVTMYDTVGGLSSASTLGSTSGAAFRSGKLQLTVHLNSSTTTALIQAFLRGITFTSKGAGLKLGHRTLQAQATDASGATSNVLSQTVNVTK
jgi:uncharacterized protein VirK/YbjX